MSYIVEDKIDNQEYLEIQRMLSENAKRRKAQQQTTASHLQSTRTRRSASSFERVPRNDEFARSELRKRASSGKRVARRTSAPAINMKALSKILLVVFAFIVAGGVALGATKNSTATEPGNNKTGPDIDTKPIVDSDNIDIEEKYAKRLSEMGVAYGETNLRANVALEDGENVVEAPAETKPVEEPVALPPTEVSDRMLDYLKSFESFEPVAYPCPAGTWTIGWGHTNGVYEGQTTTEAEATEFLRQDIDWAKDCVIEKAEELGVTLTQGQFDAFVDFAFNLGPNGFKNSGLMELMAEGDLDGAVAHLKEFVKAKNKDTGEYEVMGGLVARRAKEAEWMLA